MKPDKQKTKKRKPKGFKKKDPRKGQGKESVNQSRYCGNNDKCESCGMTYGNFKTGFTYRDIWLMFYTPKDAPPSEWKHKKRNTVLGKWFEIKQDMWAKHKEECAEQKEYSENSNDLEFDSELLDVPF